MIFITGTNTNIGKTFISAMLMSAAISQGFSPRYFKPIQTGDDCDCTTVKKLTSLPDVHIINPVFSFALPATPYLAALAENKEVDINQVLSHLKKYDRQKLIIEGAGGLLVPLTKNLLIRDLIKALNIPILIVASTQLGTINHTLLTIEAAQAAKIPIKGIVLSGNPYAGLQETLQHFSSVPVLTEIPWLENLSTDEFQKQAQHYFDKSLLENIFNEPSYAT